MRWLKLFLCLAVGGCVLQNAGCRRPHTTVEPADLIARLADADFAARLDVENTTFVSSSDPAGGNNDFNNYLRPGPPGWWVLADLKGPGYVSRFWFTGGEPSHRIRFFFDNEKTPRIDAAIGEFCGGMDVFRPPLAAYENYCFYNYVPLTYKRRLIVMVQEGATREGGWPRIFYQINHATLPRGVTTTTFTMPPAPATLAALAHVAKVWDGFSTVPGWYGGGGAAEASRSDAATEEADASRSDAATEEAGADGLVEHVAETVLAPGASWRTAVAGPGTVRELRIIPDFTALPTSAARARMLRDVVVKIYWDGLAQPSVVAPLGDLGGSFWRRTQYQSMFFGMRADEISVRFPMPFASRMELELHNQSELPLPARVRMVVDQNAAPDGRHGWFHAVWRKSKAADVGRPHTVLETGGRGRFLGCILSAVSFDNSFWLLEGDEFMWRDGAVAPFWIGTGLEDYFTGGWYYQNVMTRPLQGLPFKNFFRTVQYRVHLPDVINFNTSFRMIFERGPEHASHGELESLAWYYLDQPRGVDMELPAPFDRQPPDNPLAKVAVMLDLLNYERFGDYAGARDFIDGFLAEHEGLPYAALLRLRRAAYTERIEGLDAARPALEAFLAEPADAPAHRQARMLLDYFDQPRGALLGFNANMPARVMLDGEAVAEAESPEKLTMRLLTLTPGRHVLAVQCRSQNYPDWMQLFLRWHGGEIFTTPAWRHAVNPSGAWWLENYDDSKWKPVGGTGCKGPPEEPYVFMEPNGFVDMQSRAIALRPSADWPTKTGTVVYRCVFDVD